MRIRELVSQLGQIDTICSEEKMSMLSASRILSKHKIGALPVVDDDYGLVGVISERDIVRFIAERPEDFFNSTVKDAMTSKVITCQPDDLVSDTYKVLIKRKIRHIPVIDNDELTVMLSIRDFDKAWAASAA